MDFIHEIKYFIFSFDIFFSIITFLINLFPDTSLQSEVSAFRVPLFSR